MVQLKIIAQIFQLCLGLTTISSQGSKIEQGGTDRNLLEDLDDDEHISTSKTPPIIEWHPTPGPRAMDTEGKSTEIANSPKLHELTPDARVWDHAT